MTSTHTVHANLIMHYQIISTTKVITHN